MSGSVVSKLHKVNLTIVVGIAMPSCLGHGVRRGKSQQKKSSNSNEARVHSFLYVTYGVTFVYKMV